MSSINLSSFGPRIATTMPDDTGNEFMALTDEWDVALSMTQIEQVIVTCEVATGKQAQMRFWKDGQPSQALPIFVGVQAMDNLARFNYDRVEFRNATRGETSRIIAIAMGI